MTDDLQAAISLVKSGKKADGGRILSTLVKANPDNEQAWQWLSVCVVPEEQKRYCLKQVLRINPQNEFAKKALESLDFKPIFEQPAQALAPVIPGQLVLDKQTNLEKCIAYYVRDGYRVSSQTETSAQMVKPKQFSVILAIILFFTFFCTFARDTRSNRIFGIIHSSQRFLDVVKHPLSGDICQNKR